MEMHKGGCDPVMLGLFQQELKGQVLILSAGLSGIDKEFQPEQINSLIQTVHTIKGAARVVGLSAASSLAYAMEDLLSGIRLLEKPPSPLHIDVLMQAVEIFQMIQEQETRNIPRWINEQETLINRITQNLWTFIGNASEDIYDEELDAAEQTAEVSAEETGSVTTAGDNETLILPSGALNPAEGGEPPTEESGVTGPDETTTVEFSGEVQQIVTAEPDLLWADSRSDIVDSSQPLESQVEEIYPEQTGEKSKLVELAAECLLQSRRLRTLQTRFRAPSDTALSAPDAICAKRTDTGDSRTGGAVLPFDLFDHFTARLEKLTSQLYDEILADRTIPFDGCVQDLAGRIKELAGRLGKMLRFHTEGDDTPVAPEISEKLRKLLWLLIRQSLIQSLETPAEREYTGKTAEGLLSLSINGRGGAIHVVLTDDGRGIRQLDKKPFPGSSNAPVSADIQVEDTLDALIESLDGIIRWGDLSHGGTKIELIIPAVSFFSNCLLVSIGGESYALSMAAIDQVVRVPAENILKDGNRRFFALEGGNIDLVEAGRILNVPPVSTVPDDLAVVVVRNGRRDHGLVVDAFLGEEMLVLQPLDSRLGKVKFIRAAAMLADGGPTLVLDACELAHATEDFASSVLPGNLETPDAAGSVSREYTPPGAHIGWPFWRQQ